jgi:uncharacterized protein YjiS (DUF1127 family)
MTATHGATELGWTAAPTRHLSRFFKRCGSAFNEWRERQRLRATLYGLKDRELKDIGITRGEIEYLVLNDLTSASARAGSDE